MGQYWREGVPTERQEWFRHGNRHTHIGFRKQGKKSVNLLSDIQKSSPFQQRFLRTAKQKINLFLENRHWFLL